MINSETKPVTRKMKRITLVYFAVIFISLTTLMSCNFFSWANPPVPGADSYSFTDRGDQYFDDGQYAAALQSYSNALVVNPRNSRARIGYARSAFWLFLPSFMTEMVINYPANGEFQGKIIADIFNSPSGQMILSTSANRPVFQDIIEVLDSPYGIVNGLGDNEVAADSLEANMLLAVAYTFDMFLYLLDSDGDGNYGTSNDLIYFTNDTDIAFVIDYEGMMDTLSNLSGLSESNTIAEALSNLQEGHDMAEDTLSRFQQLYTKIDSFDKIIETLLRPKAYTELISPAIWGSAFLGGYPNMYASLVDASTNSNSLSEFIPIFRIPSTFEGLGLGGGGIVNTMHKTIVGVYAYPTNGSVMDFIPSAWDSHDGGLKKLMDDAAAVSGLTNFISSNDLDTIVSNITNSYTPEELSNLLNMIEGLGLSF